MREFAGNGQHDAHDFMCSLIEKMDMELNRQNKEEEIMRLFIGTTKKNDNVH